MEFMYLSIYPLHVIGSGGSEVSKFILKNVFRAKKTRNSVGCARRKKSEKVPRKMVALASAVVVAGLNLNAVRLQPIFAGRVVPGVAPVGLDSLLDRQRGTVIFAVRRPG